MEFPEFFLILNSENLRTIIKPSVHGIFVETLKQTTQKTVLKINNYHIMKRKKNSSQTENKADKSNDLLLFFISLNLYSYCYFLKWDFNQVCGLIVE